MTVAAVPTHEGWAQVGGVSEISRENEIKAAYLYQFGRYVQWPPEALPEADSPLLIGVLGNSPVSDILDRSAQTKQIEGRPFEVRRFASFAQYTPCHILFVTSSVPLEERKAAIAKLVGAPVLLVGDDPEFAQRGGTIGLYMEQNRMRFMINTEVAKRDQLKISSKLLNLAKLVGE